jgi:serine O-acetyltransferase
MNAPLNENSIDAELTLLGNEQTAQEFRLTEVHERSDAVWSDLRRQAAEECSSEPSLARLYASIFEARSLEEALVQSLAKRLGHSTLPAEELRRILLEPALSDASIGEAARADLKAVVERDPASDRLLDPFLFFKGYAALQTQRIAHRLWKGGRSGIALYLQCRSSEVFQTDIHPGAKIGKGVFLDHATGFVAGETVVIEDDVSILHGVTLGGTGTDKGERHPKVRTGVLIGAGAQIIGDIEIGAYSKIASGSFVTESVPPRCTAVGVPARILQGAGSSIPAETMDQQLAQGTYESFNYVI